MAIIVCIYNATMHFIEKWDGHFRDAKGCTTLQTNSGKLFKVDSCNGNVEQIYVVPTDDNLPRNTAPQFTAPYGVKPPAQALPPKKPGAPQAPNPDAPKLNPYMI